jgi:hypothetical protein
LINAHLSDLLAKFHSLEYKIAIGRKTNSDAGPYMQKNYHTRKFDTKLRVYTKSAKSFGTGLLIK